MLVAGELPEDSQFPTIDRDLLEAVKYASLWAMKDAKRICDSKFFLGVHGDELQNGDQP